MRGQPTTRQTPPGALDTPYQQSFAGRAEPYRYPHTRTPEKGADHRDGLYALRDTAAALALSESRVCVCGRRMAPTAASVEVRTAPSGRAYFAGVLSCGSVWTCPVCAAKIARARQVELSALLARHLAAGGAGLFLTLTVPHDVGQPLRELRATVAGAFRKLLGGERWRARRARFGLCGYVRALEVTHGRNGWHPHLHVLLFLNAPLPKSEQAALHAALFAVWAREVARAGLRAPHPELCPLVPIYSADAADYAAKVSAVLELTRWDAKGARASGRAPFQILRDYATTGSGTDAALWREWCDDIRGARQLTYSRGLRERYAVEVATDEEIAAAEVGGATLLTFGPAAWRAVCRVPMLRADILRAAERGGAAEVFELLDSLPHWPPGALVTVPSGAGAIPAAA